MKGEVLLGGVHKFWGFFKIYFKISAILIKFLKFKVKSPQFLNTPQKASINYQKKNLNDSKY
jgi:hypothetical protein